MRMGALHQQTRDDRGTEDRTYVDAYGELPRTTPLPIPWYYSHIRSYTPLKAAATHGCAAAHNLCLSFWRGETNAGQSVYFQSV